MKFAGTGGVRPTALLLFFLSMSLILDLPVGASPSAQEVRRLRKLETLRHPDTSSTHAADGQSTVDETTPPLSPSPAAYICPMHADYKSKIPSVCGVCGMALQASAKSPRAGAQMVITRRQAEQLTLRFSEARPMRIERWLRTSAVRTGERMLEGLYTGPDGGHIQPGHNARAFPMQSRGRIFRGIIRSVEPKDGGQQFHIELDSEFDGAEVYVIDIVVVYGTRLAIPSDAILFTADGPSAFKLDSEDTEALRLSPVPVRIGRRGEVYYEVLQGLAEGDRVAQVGLFYLDAAAQLQKRSGYQP